jgi:hypothetical protein
VRLKLLLLFLVLLIALPSRIRSQNTLPPLPGRPPMAPSNDPMEEQNDEKIRKTVEKKMNQERQAQLKRDTDKLLQLSTELKQYVDKTNQNVMSIDVIKKAEEIEKLAHSVKEKMKGG